MGNALLTPLVERLLSRIGLWKPHVKPLGPRDELWLFTNTAFRNPLNQSQWLAEFVACFFKQDSGDRASRTIADLVEKLGIVKGDVSELIVASRVDLFLSVTQPARTVELAIQHGAGGKILLGPAGSNGISSNILRFPHSYYTDTQLVPSSAKLPPGYGQDGDLTGFETMTTVFADPEGWGVISDIDDTIKITHVLSHLAVLKYTFALPPAPVPGMPEFYSNVLHPTLNNPVWFYLSASPYNLYPFIAGFLDDYRFPKGTTILRDLSWQDLQEFIYISLTVDTAKYKLDRLHKIHEWFPKRKMVLIGDSTQSDPEVYGAVARKWEHWVGAVYIRLVKGVDEEREKKLNCRERFEKAFEGVNRKLWVTFDDVEELIRPLTVMARADPSGTSTGISSRCSQEDG